MQVLTKVLAISQVREQVQDAEGGTKQRLGL